MLILALVHFPCVNKQGRVVTTAITNFDIHDIARAGCTYGVAKYFLVTPVELQQQFARRIITHWVDGWGAEYNPTRGEALANVDIASDLSAVGDAIEREFGRQPLWVATSARPYAHGISCDALRERIKDEPVCLIFGTGHGLHPEIIEQADAILEPLRGPMPFNHLSVRSAVSIYLDRLLAPRD